VPLELLAILIIALVFDFANGVQGSANIVATLISSRVMRPRRALWLAASAELLGSFLFGVAVAATIGEDFVDTEAITPLTLFAGLLGATLWNISTIYSRIPSSASHALIGGLIGSAVADGGLRMLQTKGVLIITGGLFAAPFIGMVMGYGLVRVIYFFAHRATPKVNQWFQGGQVLTAVLLALVFGSNDGQKVMGVIMLGLVLTGESEDFAIPFWVMVVSAVTLALGTLAGGERLVRTLGTRFYKIRPVHGLAAQLASDLVILIAGLLGGPVSTTQVVGSSIIGAGSADRLNKIRWGVFDRIVWTWVLTIPAAAIIAALIFWTLSYV
jgi:PiT family inorganic phosphate transporter